MDEFEEAVDPQADMNEPIDDQQSVETNVQEHNDGEREKTMIPLSVAQKLREKKRELELELQFERQERQRLMQSQSRSQPEEEDDSRYESATREDLTRTREETVRDVEERLWIRQNPEKYELINEQLPTFLKQRPNLALAITNSANRYEEAYALMTALSPKQQTQLKKDAIKKDAPHAPNSVPKAAALNEAVDIMSMSDKEFADWRASKRRRR